MAPFEDRFSILPEAILITVLSFLPIKEAVRASILAKPWRYLWRSLPNVEINERLFATPLTEIDQQHPNTEFEGQNHMFKQQIDCLEFGFKWLLDGLFPISSFSLTFSDPQNWHVDIVKLLSLALKCNTKSLELDFSCPIWVDKLPLTDETTERFDLPDFVYDHNLLESLKLVSCRFLEDEFTIIGRTLKSVTLAWVSITNVSTLRKLVQSCPLLEYLSLSKCFDATDYVIHSNTLKTIIVDKCVDLLSLTIVAPNLIHFKYCGNVVRFGIIMSTNLQTAELDYGLVGMFNEEDGEKIARFLDNLCYARSLVVSIVVMSHRIVPLGCQPVLPLVEVDPAQNNARNLTIKTAFHESEFKGIRILLDNYPFLEQVRFEHEKHIIFEEDMAYYGYYAPTRPETYWARVKPWARGCVPGMLKVVEIIGFQGNQNEINLLIYLLSHGSALRKLVLRAAHQRGEEVAIRIKDIAKKRQELKVQVISQDGVIYEGTRVKEEVQVN